MYRSQQEIQNELDNLLKELKAIASEDNEITYEEKHILDHIEKDFTRMKTQIFQVLESELEDDEFNDLVNDFLWDAIQNAINVASLDGIISDDEKKLIKKLHDFVEKGGRM